MTWGGIKGDSIRLERVIEQEDGGVQSNLRDGRIGNGVAVLDASLVHLAFARGKNRWDLDSEIPDGSCAKQPDNAERNGDRLVDGWKLVDASGRSAAG